MWPNTLSTIIQTDWLPEFPTGTNQSTIWNNFVAYLKSEDEMPDTDEWGFDGNEAMPDKGFLGTGINPLRIVSSFPIPDLSLSVYIPVLGEIDLLDFMLTIWLFHRTPWPNVIICSVPILPIMYWLLRNITVPGSELLQSLIVTPHSGAPTGFTVRDVCIDAFCIDMIHMFVKVFGPHALQPLLYLFNWWINYRKPKIRDVIRRIKEPGSSDKFSDEDENQIYTVVSNYSDEFLEWLAYLSDPVNVSRPVG
jgi:hypothetical protein